MYTDINSITQQYFQKETLDNVSKDELEGFISRHPYSAAARYLLAQKLFNDSSQNSRDELVTAGLYFHNPLWLDWLLNNNKESLIPQEVPVTGSYPERGSHPPQAELAEPSEAEGGTTEPPIVFQSYHTIDYFASQGIRLDSADLTRDRLGQQLKSFTEWLKSMKKLPMSEIEKPRNLGDDTNQQQVISNAAHSIEDKEVMTEAMAEVWAKQGNTAKAIDIYNKLSLQDPAKSAYFAAKIDQLK